MNLISKLATSVAMISALAGSAEAADYVQESRFGFFGAGHSITYTHTEPVTVYTNPQNFCTVDACGNVYSGTRWTPRVAEKVTSQCTTRHVHLEESFIALPGNILTAVGNAITPRGTTPGRTTCQHSAPAGYGCGCR